MPINYPMQAGNGTNYQVPNTGNYINYPNQMTTSGWGNQPPQMMNSRVMSIAPSSSRENAQQFPVAVNTDLYLINMNEMKLYLKNNPQNPAEMREFDIVEVIKQNPVSDTVSRAEFDEMKSMMSQMMGILQGNQNEQQQRPPKNQYNNGKRGSRNDQPRSVQSDNG